MTFIDQLQTHFPELDILKNEPMAKHTSFRIGGPVCMIFPKTCDSLVQVYRFCLSHGEAPRILGAGTNILAPDNGMEQLVICTRDLAQVRLLRENTLEAECGVLLSKAACFARDHSLSGMEFAAGIPGTIGGAVYMNAGAYGGEMRQIVERTLALLPDGSLLDVEGDAHEFSYRHSVFEAKNALILKTQLRLLPANKIDITEKMRELAQKRRSSQPLDVPSAGSTFKRPVGGYAAALIDAAGLKGKGIGGAAVSEKHAGFVVNLGNATARDVLATMEYIQKKVYESSGVALEPEVRIW